MKINESDDTAGVNQSLDSDENYGAYFQTVKGVNNDHA